MSHRYGSRLLPSQISQTTFNILKEECGNIEFDYEINQNTVHIDNVLEKMYILDENDVPPVYKLVETNMLIPQFQIKVKKLNLSF